MKHAVFPRGTFVLHLALPRDRHIIRLNLTLVGKLILAFLWDLPTVSLNILVSVRLENSLGRGFSRFARRFYAKRSFSARLQQRFLLTSPIMYRFWETATDNVT